MSWGHLTSKDMLAWEVAPHSPALRPDQAYDHEGVFTGCWMPNVSPKDSKLTVVYSSVRQLPFHWSTPPYPRDAAGIAMATSDDGGHSWTKSSENPILSGEPAGLSVTGFRDPYVAEWPAMDQVLLKDKPSLYGLVSGGIEGVGPTSFLYEVSRDDPAKWEYLGPLIDVPRRYQPSEKWTGNFGMNWECVNFMTLEAGGHAHDFLIIGAEGDCEKAHVEKYARPSALPPRTIRSQLWMSGSLAKTERGVRFQPKISGYLDHGPYYAANSFVDPKTGRRIVYGWIPEEDISTEAAKQKGWNGSLAMPREIFALRLPNVVTPSGSQAPHSAWLEMIDEPDGSVTAVTLGIRPLAEIMRLRDGAQRSVEAPAELKLPLTTGTGAPRKLFSTRSASWELEATIQIRPGCATAGFFIRHSDDQAIRTAVVFSVSEETITVDRSQSTSASSVNKCPERGPFTLLDTRAETDGVEHQSQKEHLRLRVFSDGDVLEVFANERFALATMIYSAQQERAFGGVSAFATGDPGSAVFEQVRLWDGLDLSAARKSE